MFIIETLNYRIHSPLTDKRNCGEINNESLFEFIARFLEVLTDVLNNSWTKFGAIVEQTGRIHDILIK